MKYYPQLKWAIKQKYVFFFYLLVWEFEIFMNSQAFTLIYSTYNQNELYLNIWGLNYHRMGKPLVNLRPRRLDMWRAIFKPDAVLHRAEVSSLVHVVAARSAILPTCLKFWPSCRSLLFKGSSSSTFSEARLSFDFLSSFNHNGFSYINRQQHRRSANHGARGIPAFISP